MADTTTITTNLIPDSQNPSSKSIISPVQPAQAVEQQRRDANKPEQNTGTFQPENNDVVANPPIAQPENEQKTSKTPTDKKRIRTTRPTIYTINPNTQNTHKISTQKHKHRTSKNSAIIEQLRKQPFNKRTNGLQKKQTARTRAKTETMPNGVMPEGVRPVEALPEVAMPVEAMPEVARPIGAIPEGAMPVEAIPEEAMPEEARPEVAGTERTRPEEEAMPRETQQKKRDKTSGVSNNNVLSTLLKNLSNLSNQVYSDERAEWFNRLGNGTNSNNQKSSKQKPTTQTYKKLEPLGSLAAVEPQQINQLLISAGIQPISVADMIKHNADIATNGEAAEKQKLFDEYERLEQILMSNPKTSKQSRHSSQINNSA